MIFKTEFFVLTFVFVLANATDSFAQSVQPGNWQAKTEFKVDGISFPTSLTEECITPDQAIDVKASIAKGLLKLGCVLAQWKVLNNNLEAELECKTSAYTAKGRIRGQFTDKAYQLEGNAHGLYHNIVPTSASLLLTGQWTKDCAATSSATGAQALIR